MISARRRWLAGALLVGLGWLSSPHAVPVYDGLDQPDEPYRYVDPPKGATRTTEPAGTTTTTPVKAGVSVNGLTVQTDEKGPQFSLYLPPGSMASPGAVITVAISPRSGKDGPSGVVVDGNAYRVELTDPAGPVTLTDRAAVATLYLRATSQAKPQPTMYYRPVGGTWQALDTTAGGFDIRVASFEGPGDYLVARPPGETGGGLPVAPLVVVVVLVVVIGVVVVIRLRAQPTAE